MTIISQETWDNIPKEEKGKILNCYNSGYNDWGCFITLEKLFGKENLLSETIFKKCIKSINEYFDMQIQDAEWNKCSEQEQQNILEIYNNHPEWLDVINALEDKFGEHNLRPKPKIKTWEDCQKMNEDSNFFMRIDDNLELPDKVYSKCIATLKIAKLIELGYGGMVTEEEWEDEYKSYWVINCDVSKENKFEILEMVMDKFFIAFHEESQAEEFMSYPENLQLIKDYYMV